MTADALTIVIHLVSALVAGGVIGLERSYHGRPAGFRTHALVCLASSLLMLVSVYQNKWFLEIPLETVYAAIDFGNEHGIPVLLNPAPAHPDLDIERVKGATYFMPNETELALLTGLPVDTLDEVKVAAQLLLDKGVQDVVVTLGSRGALWINGEHETLIPAVEVKARDTTGAGDAFIGCFSHYLVATGDVEESLTIAARYAADSVTKLGTQTSYATGGEFHDGAGLEG